MNYAIDKDNLLRIAGGPGRTIDCIFPPTLPGYDADCHRIRTRWRRPRR